MARYKTHQYLKSWERSLNDGTFHPATLDVLDFISYCRKYGCRTSNDRIAKEAQRHHNTVQRAIPILEQHLLVRVDNPGKRTRTIHRIDYSKKADWHRALRAKNEADKGSVSVHISRESLKTTPKRSLNSLSHFSEASETSAGVSLPQTPAGSTDRCSGGTGESAADRKRKEELFREVIYNDAYRKFLDDEHPEDRAKNLAQIRTERKIAERRARLKSREEAMTKDQRTENPKLD